LGMMLAAGTEVLQLWVPHRAFNPMDLLFNVSGVVAGGLIFGWFLIMKRT
jgi:VanZ family protein